MHKLQSRVLTLACLFALPGWLHAGLGQGTLDYSKRNGRIQGQMYKGSMFQGADVRSYKNLRYGMSGSNASQSRFNRNFNSRVQEGRFSTHVRQEKQSIWSRMKAGLFKKKETRMMDTGRYSHPGMTYDNRRFSQYSNTVRIDNGTKGTRRISASDINEFVDPRSSQRSKAGIPVQGPVEIIPLKR